MVSKAKRAVKNIFRNWEILVNIILPLVLLPLLFIQDDQIVKDGKEERVSTKFKCLYVLILMATFWVLETLPLAVTALLPMVLFPLLGVQDTAQVSESYMKETNMMFIGGLIIAMAVEYCNLHRRIALNVVTTIGVSPARLMFGIMLTTTQLSMWMSNTATAAMMCPIAIAVVNELYPKPPEDGKRRRASIYKERSEVDFETFMSKVKAKREKLMQLQKSPTSTTTEMILEPELDIPSTMVIEPEVEVVQVRKVPRIKFELDDDAPVDSSKLMKLEAKRDAQRDIELGIIGMDQWDEDEDVDADKRSNLQKMLLYSILLSANVGGTSVITGSPSNLVFQELIKPINIGQGGVYMDISFATWMVYNVPPMVVNVTFCFLYLVIIFYGFPTGRTSSSSLEECVAEKKKEMENEALERVMHNLQEKKEALGKMTFHEIAVSVLFLAVVLLWLLRDPKFMPGWANFVSSTIEIGDSTPALLVVLLMFIIPRKLDTLSEVGVKTPPLLDWKYVQANLPWGVVLLMGGGFALSKAVVGSGMSQWLGQQLKSLESLPTFMILVIVLFICATVTEVASNSACVNVVVPILLALSETLDLHPLYLSLPATVVCSYAFLLPVATPTNAIVFTAGGGSIKIIEMFKIMLVPNLLCIVTIVLSHVSYGNLIFNFDDYVYLNSTLSR